MNWISISGELLNQNNNKFKTEEKVEIKRNIEGKYKINSIIKDIFNTTERKEENKSLNLNRHVENNQKKYDFYTEFNEDEVRKVINQYMNIDECIEIFGAKEYI